MSKPRQLRTAIVDRIKDAQLGFKDVTAHVGRYSVADLQRLLGASPAVAVGLVGGSKPKACASGEVQIELTFAAVIVTRAARLEDADDEAIDLALGVAVSLSTWVPATVIPTCQPAAGIHMEPVADDEVDKAGLTVWAVLWSHTVRVGVDAVGAGVDEERPLNLNQVVTVNDGHQETAIGGVP